MSLIAARRGESNVERIVRRRFCPRCGTRISRSANKCAYCRKFLPRWTHIAGIALLFIILLLLLWFLTS